MNIWEGFESKQETHRGDCPCPVTQPHCLSLSLLCNHISLVGALHAWPQECTRRPLLLRTPRAASGVCRREEGELSQLWGCQVSQPTAVLVKGKHPVAGWGRRKPVCASLASCFCSVGQWAKWGLPPDIPEQQQHSAEGIPGSDGRALTDRRARAERSNGTAKATQ